MAHVFRTPELALLGARAWARDVSDGFGVGHQTDRTREVEHCYDSFNRRDESPENVAHGWDLAVSAWQCVVCQLDYEADHAEEPADSANALEDLGKAHAIRRQCQRRAEEARTHARNVLRRVVRGA